MKVALILIGVVVLLVVGAAAIGALNLPPAKVYEQAIIAEL